MKGIKITYWISTSIIALMVLFSAYAYLAKPEMTAAFHHLGYPDYFRVELAIAKIIGAALLLIPVGGRIKEWTYAGFSITFISAMIAHASSGDAVTAPLIFIVILAVSYITYLRSQGALKVNAALK